MHVYSLGVIDVCFRTAMHMGAGLQEIGMKKYGISEPSYAAPESHLPQFV